VGQTSVCARAIDALQGEEFRRAAFVIVADREAPGCMDRPIAGMTMANISATRRQLPNFHEDCQHAATTRIVLSPRRVARAYRRCV